MLANHGFDFFRAVAAPAVAEEFIAVFIHLRVLHDLHKCFAQKFDKLIRCALGRDYIFIKLRRAGPRLVSLPSQPRGLFSPKSSTKVGASEKSARR